MPGTGSNARRPCGGASVAIPTACAAASQVLAQTEPDGGTGGQTVTRDIPIGGAAIGQSGLIYIDARGDMAGTGKVLSIVDLFGGAALASIQTGVTGGTYNRVARQMSVECGDLGGGQVGLRLQITAAAAVAATTGMPNGWSWQFRIAGVVS